VKLAALILPLTISVALWGCGGGSHSESTVVHPPTPIQADQPKPTAHCEQAMGGTPPRSWRRDSTATGPIGFYGLGRNFLFGRFTSRTKAPAIVEGHDPVTLSIAPGDRWHARLLAPTSPPFVPYVEIRFVPCRDQARTTWPAGFQLRNRMPVTVIVRRPGQPDRRLTVGRI
jgi:hypothetical protein